MKNRALLLLSTLLPLLLAACAAKKTEVAVVPESGEKIIRIEASSFSFTPADIRAHQGDRLTFRVVNVADATHNFTVENPRGEPVLSVDLPAQKTIEISLELSEEGTWKYYCDKPLHASLGMRGSIEAAPRR